jgi:hypothetical protein
MSNEHYPLRWPEGWPRTLGAKRKNSAPFKVNSDKARRELMADLRRMGATNIIVSSNVPVRQDGTPYADAARRVIRDPGVVVYFTRDGHTLSMARDQYQRPEDNLRSIGLAIEAIRAIERHGGSYMMERAFSGFAALPPPTSHWEILGLRPGSSADDIKRAHRAKIGAAHPDTGGSEAAASALNAARDAALREIGG